MRNILILLASLLPFTATGQDTLFDKNGKPRYAEIVEVIPVPPVKYVNVDNVDSKIVYAAPWTHNGETTAPGFFNNTIAYDATAGRTATLIFTGTSIEAFCEKLSGHGSAAFQVDNLAPTTVPMGTGSVGGSTSVYKVDNLTAGQHTFKITVVGGGNVVFDYVKIDGEAVAPPIVPIPPVTGMVFLTPGVSAKTSIESASSGTKFQLGNGAYPETSINVPAGVSIFPPTSGTAYIDYVGSAVAPGGNYTAIFNLTSSSRANGNQTISGFTIRGANKANAGIYANNRDNLTVNNVIIQNCTFFGMWFANMNGLKVFNNEVSNSSWGSASWCSGEINLGALVTNFNIHHNILKNNPGKGYGIKGLKHNNIDGRFSGLIEYNDLLLGASSSWNGNSGPNIDIEFESVFADAGDVTIQFNNMKNMASMAGHKVTGNTGKWILQNNTMNGQAGSTCAVETSCNNLRAINNTIRGFPMLSVNYNKTRYNDILFDGNDFVSSGTNPGWGATIYIGSAGVDNFIYKNNKITTGPLTNGFTFLKYAGVQCCVTNGGGNTIN